jgi:hypothetical protein
MTRALVVYPKHLNKRDKKKEIRRLKKVRGYSK